MESLEVKANYLQRAYSWADAHFGEAIQAIYRSDSAAALNLLAQAAGALSKSGLPVDLNEALTVRMRYLRWQAERIGQPEAVITRLRGELLDELQAVVGSAYGTGTARGYVIQLRTIDMRDHGLPYPQAEFRDDLAQVPPEMWTKELRLYLAAWAFMNGDLVLLDDCYAVFMTEADGFMSAFLWQRVNLMQLLLRGTAGARDVEELLKRIEHPNQWHDFEMLLFPTCLKLGLLDSPETLQVLGRVLHNLNAGPLVMPKRLERTGRIRRD